MAIKVLVAGIAVCLALPVAAQGNIPYQDAESVARGAALYQDHCAACHGEALEGQENWQRRDAEGFLPAPPHDETGHTWHHGDGLLFDIVKRGTEAVVGGGYQSNMPGFAEVLSDQEILDTLAFIKSTWSNRVIEIQNSRN